MDKLYPIGIQTFEIIRKEGYCYVDKTALIYQLVKSGRYYFLSRPRRFGKSLLISTLEAYFRGKKELFAGLAIEQLEQEWTEYPVLHLDLNARLYENTSSLTAILNQHLEQWEAIYGEEKKDRAPEERFAYLIEKFLQPRIGVIIHGQICHARGGAARIFINIRSHTYVFGVGNADEHFCKAVFHFSDGIKTVVHRSFVYGVHLPFELNFAVIYVIQTDGKSDHRRCKRQYYENGQKSKNF